MQFYIYLLLIFCIICSILSVFSKHFFKSIISFFMLIIGVCLIGIIRNNTLLSLVIFIGYITVNCILILIYFHNNNINH